MVKVSVLSGYDRCEKCNGPFETLYYGGVGHWRDKIMCELCFHVRGAVPFDDIIVPAVALQYNISEGMARERLLLAERDYVATVAKLTVNSLD